MKVFHLFIFMWLLVSAVISWNGPSLNLKENPKVIGSIQMQVCIGAGIVIDDDVWDLLEIQKKPSLYVKNLAVAVWGSDVLLNRSVDGKTCPRYKTAPRQPLTPVKLDAVRGKF